MPADFDSLPRDTIRVPALAPPGAFVNALALEDWSSAQEFIGQIDRDFDASKFARFSALLSLAQDKRDAAARLFRRAASESRNSSDLRAKLCVALALLCERNPMESVRASLETLALARDQNDNDAALAAERLMHLAIASTSLPAPSP